MTEHTYTPEILEAIEDEMRRHTNTIAGLSKLDACVRDAKAAIAYLHITRDIPEHVDVYSYIVEGGGQVWLCAHTGYLDDIVPITRCLRKLGYRMEDEPAHEFKDDEPGKLWKFDKYNRDGEMEMSGCIGVLIKLPPDEVNACELVQVGTKEVPVYEFKCGPLPETKPKEATDGEDTQDTSS